MSLLGDIVISDVHTVSGTESYGTVTLSSGGTLVVPSGTSLLAATVVCEAGSRIEVAGGSLSIRTSLSSARASLAGSCAHLNVTSGGELLVEGAQGYADTFFDGPYDDYIQTSMGGDACVNLTVTAGLHLENASLIVTGGDGFDLPSSTQRVSNAWCAGGTLGGRAAAGGNATLGFTLGPGSIGLLTNSTLSAIGGRGGNASKGGAASSVGPGKGGGYCNGGTVEDDVGTGGCSDVALVSSSAVTLRSSTIVSTGGAGGRAGDGGAAFSAGAGGGGGGYAGGDGSGPGVSGYAGIVRGRVGSGGPASVRLLAASLEVEGTNMSVQGGDAGAAGKGGNGASEGGGGGGGYGGGGGTGRAGTGLLPGSGSVSGKVGSGGPTEISLNATLLQVGSSNLSARAGSGGEAGDGGDGFWGGSYDGGGAGGGGYGGGGGGGDNTRGGNTAVRDLVGSGGGSALVLLASRMNLLDALLRSSGGPGGDGGTGGLGPYGGGGGGGYGGAGGGGGGAYVGGTCTVTSQVGTGGNGTVSLDGVVCASPGTYVNATEGLGGTAPTSKGGGPGGAGTGLVTANGTASMTVPLCIPYLISPKNGSRTYPSWLVYYAMNSTTNGDVVLYRVQVSMTVDFSDMVINETNTTGSTRISSLAPGRYHWRVMAFYGQPSGSTIGWSDIYSFGLYLNFVPRFMHAIEDITMLEDTVDDYSIDLKYVFWDPEGDPLTYDVEDGPGIVATVLLDHRVSLAPNPNWTGTETIAFIAKDPYDHETPFPRATVNITVINVNDPPVIATMSIGPAVEDEAFEVLLSASDPDPTGDILSWSIEGCPPFLTLHPATGELTGVPDNSHVGEHWMNVSASDGLGGVDRREFSLKVINVNDPPVITTSPILECLEDEPYLVTWAAVDDDPTGDVLTWDLMTAPAFLSIGALNGTLMGTPGNSDVGLHGMVVRVSDGKGGEDTLGYDLQVINVNDPPSIKPGTGLTFVEDKTTSVDFTDYVTDIDNPIEELEMGCAGAWVRSIDGLVVEFLFTLPVEHGTMEVNVSDGDSTVSALFPYIVFPVNDAPKILGIGSQLPPTVILVDEGTLSVLEVLFEDEEGDPLSFEVLTNLQGVTILGNGSLRIASEIGILGDFGALLKASDGHGGTGELVFTISVRDVNNPPEVPEILSPLANGSYKEGTSIALRALVDDPDLVLGQVLMVTWSSDRSGDLITLRTDGDLNFSTDGLPSGRHRITVTVFDGEHSRSAFVDITVVERHAVGGGLDILVLALLIVVIAVVSGWLLVRRRRRQGT